MLKFDPDSNSLEKLIAAVNQLAINHPRFGDEFVGTGRAFRVDVQYFVAVGDQPVGDDHAMAAEVNAFGAHVGGARLLGDLQQLSMAFSNSGVSV